MTNLYDNFDTADEIIAYLLHDAGPDRVQELMALLVGNEIIERREMMEIADKLKDAGLSEGAAIVLDAAVQIAECVSPQVTAILQGDNLVNIRAGLASLYRQDKFSPADWAYC